MNMLPVRSACQGCRAQSLHERRVARGRSRRRPPVVCSARVLTGRAASAVIVEVEAYGGPADGPWPDAGVALVPRARRTQRRDVRAGRAAVHLSQPWHPRVRQRRVRLEDVAGAVLLRAAAVRRRNRRGARPPRPAATATRRSPAAQATCARRSESPWTTTESTCSTADGAGPLDPGRAVRRAVRPARRREQGRRPPVAVLARRPSRGVGLPAQSAGTRTGRSATDAGGDRRWPTSSTSWTGAD